MRNRECTSGDGCGIGRASRGALEKPRPRRQNPPVPPLTFPVEIPIGPWRLPPHPVFESLAYLVGARVFWVLRRRDPDPLTLSDRWSIIVAAALGAAVGSRVLSWLDDPALTWSERGSLFYWLGGKTIVGGLLGGLIAVEWAKHRMGVHRSTGDPFVIPLCVGMAIGRIGCFLTGLPDHTYGNPTSLPFGVDFGDGVRRHPAQLYEIVALAAIAAWTALGRIRAGASIPASGAMPPASAAIAADRGGAFRGFMVGYLAFRLALEAIKPGAHRYLGLDGIQVACVAGLVYYAALAWRRRTSGALAGDGR